jgi:hypothetical protein
VQTCDVASPASPVPGKETVRCTMKAQNGGNWKVVAVVVDEYKRKNQTATSLWVIGAGPLPRNLSFSGTNTPSTARSRRATWPLHYQLPYPLSNPYSHGRYYT